MSKEKPQQPKMDWGFYAMTPRIVRTQYKSLSHAEKWLYTCLKDLCGDKGACFRTLRKLNEETDISTGSLTPMIMHLHKVGLIHAEKKRRPKGTREIWHITITDIWQANYAYCSNLEHSQCSENEHSTDPSSQCSKFEQREGVNVQNLNISENNSSLQCSNFATRRRYTKNKDTYEEDKVTENDVASANHSTLSPSPEEMIAYLSQIGFTITRNCASDNDSQSQQLQPTPVAMSQNAHPFVSPPRSQGEISPDHDRTGDTIQRSHYIATQNSIILPPETSENSHDTIKPSNDTPVTSRGSQRENEASQPDAACSLASYSQDKEPPLAAEKSAVPQLPPAEMKWSPEKLVQITEAKRIARGKVGVYFDEDIRGNSAKSQRQRQLEAAKRILAKGVTEEEYIKAYDERNDEWWNQTQGSLTVEEMAANTKNRVMRILEILEKLETMSKAIGLKQAGQGQKWNATQQQQRTERAAQENAHSAAMNGGLTYSEINRLKPAEKKAYLEKLKEQQQQKNLAAAQ